MDNQETQSLLIIDSFPVSQRESSFSSILKENHAPIYLPWK